MAIFKLCTPHISQTVTNTTPPRLLLTINRKFHIVDFAVGRFLSYLWSSYTHCCRAGASNKGGCKYI